MQEVDCLVIGSGFGGAVSALRMAEKGYDVVVLEQGRRLQRGDIEAGGRSVRRRIASKKKRGEVKALRGGVGDDD